MKEAAGEANLTVVAIILIGVVVAVVTPLVNSMMQSSAKRACCNDAGYIWKDNECHSVGPGGAVGSAVTNYWNATNNTCNSNTTTS